MQDVVMRESANDIYYFGVFDGHGSRGLEVAEFAASAISSFVSQKSPKNIRAAAKGLREELKRTHQTLATDEIAQYSGTTATVVAAKGGKLAVAYVGDSEAVYYPDGQPANILTKPHTTYHDEEVKRVNSMGYFVQGSYFASGDKLIAMSRAIGDFDRPFIVAEADVKLLRISRPGTLVVASDGVWSASRAYEKNINRMVRSTSDYQAFADEAAQLMSKMTGDNASLVVARLE